MTRIKQRSPIASIVISLDYVERLATLYRESDGTLAWYGEGNPQDPVIVCRSRQTLRALDELKRDYVGFQFGKLYLSDGVHALICDAIDEFGGDRESRSTMKLHPIGGAA